MRSIVKTDKTRLVRMTYVEQARFHLSEVIDTNPLDDYESEVLTEALRILNAEKLWMRCNFELDEWDEE